MEIFISLIIGCVFGAMFMQSRMSSRGKDPNYNQRKVSFDQLVHSFSKLEIMVEELRQEIDRSGCEDDNERLWAILLLIDTMKHNSVPPHKDSYASDYWRETVQYEVIYTLLREIRAAFAEERLIAHENLEVNWTNLVAFK
ncbi:hypothetical protein N9513_08195 [Gammaproteobacteria bacterium]|nr:hypothetical protein [Gammaproteobacteria bacterium]